MRIMSIIIFSISILGIILNRNYTILILVCIELMLLSLILTITIFTIKIGSIIGQIFSLYIATVAAIESAIGLSILIVFYKIRGSISIRMINLLKG